ncbi:MAG: hypothetical protein IT457_09515 [Planctomycetes bacterium]|nr:hypothetical protein [Planctomycetota bacterium]
MIRGMSQLLLAGFVAVLSSTASPPAQSASGTNHFLVAGEVGAGGTSRSFTHVLTGTFAGGVPAVRAFSTGFVLLGGFPAAIEVPATGRPWLCGVRPAFAPLRGGASLVLHGTELDIGPTPVITIGGRPAPTGARTRATIQTTLPNSPPPGYQPVVVNNLLGTSTLPKGIGILPLLELSAAPRANVPFALRYVGATGDLVVFALAAAQGATAIPIPPLHHVLELDLVTLLALPSLTVSRPDGTLELVLPGTPLGGPLYFQAVTLSQDPGWSPGSFTNLVRI